VSGWLIAEQATRYSEAIKTLPQHPRAIAPALLPMEYTNVLRTACAGAAVASGLGVISLGER